jgi:hypothetical protein
MRNTLAIFLISTALLFTACGGDDVKHSSDYQEKKASIADQEKSSPKSFLTVKFDYHKNLLGKWVVEGEVKNSGSVITYKNITLQVEYMDKDGGTMIKDNEAIDGEVKPNSSLDFKIKEPKVKGARSVNVKIVSAEG